MKKYERDFTLKMFRASDKIRLVAGLMPLFIQDNVGIVVVASEVLSLVFNNYDLSRGHFFWPFSEIALADLITLSLSSLFRHYGIHSCKFAISMYGHCIVCRS